MFFLLKSLQALDKKKNDNRRISAIFDIRALTIAGFMPYMDNCINCGDPHIEYFHPEGMLCPNCIDDTDCVRLTPDGYLSVVRITAYSIENVYKLEFSPQVLDEIIKCAKLMIKHYISEPHLYV